MTYVICRSDDPRWPEERRKRITASQVNVWLGTQPSFFEETKETLVARKLAGGDAVFNDRSRRRMTHGREREAGALQMAGKLFGFPTARYSYLIGNERWPHIAATLDGLLFPWVGAEPDYDLTSQVGHMAEIRSIIEYVEEPVMCEVKVSDSGHRYKEKNGDHAGQRAWVDFCPTYHREQVQTGLWVTGLNHALLVGLLGGDELICWYNRRDPGFERTLDHVDREASEELAGLWR